LIERFVGKKVSMTKLIIFWEILSGLDLLGIRWSIGGCGGLRGLCEHLQERRAGTPALHLSVRLQDVAREVLVFYDVGQHFADVVGVYFYVFAFFVGGVEADFV